MTPEDEFITIACITRSMHTFRNYIRMDKLRYTNNVRDLGPGTVIDDKYFFIPITNNQNIYGFEFDDYVLLHDAWEIREFEYILELIKAHLKRYPKILKNG